MALKQTVRIEGLKELDAALGELSKAAARGVARRVLAKAGQPIADTASALAPDDPATGAPDLHTSIKVGTKIRNAAGNKEYADTLASGGTKAEAVSALRDARRAAGASSFAEVYVGPVSDGKKNAIKALVQEFGSVKQAAHPYMRPAWEQQKGTALQIVKSEMGGEIDKAVQRARRRALKKASQG